MRMRNFIKMLYYPDRKFYKLVFALTIPIVCQNLITIGVNIVDTMMLGALGITQLSAASLATQFVNMFQTFVMGTSMGAAVLSARYWGMKELSSLRKTIAIMMRIILLLATVFAGITFLAPDTVMRMYTSDTAVIEEGVRYLRFAVLTFYLHGLSQGSTIILRSVQKVKLPLYVSIASFLLNLVGNYVFIFGKFGFPAMGIAGASLSTLIARSVECLFNFGYLAVMDQDIRFRIRHLFMKTEGLFREYIRISFPVLVSDGFLALGNNVVMMIVGRMGQSFVAANAITAIIERLCTSGISGVGQTSAMIIGKNLGEGDKEKVQRQGVAFFGIGLGLGLLAAGIIVILKEPVILAYHLTGETADVTRQLFWASALLVIFQAANGILTKGTLRGGGDTKVLMIADSIFLWLVSVPLGYVSGLVLHMTGFWVYFFLRSENICKTIWSVHRLQSGKWIKPIKSFETKA